MAAESPVVLVQWYDVVKWFLERVDSFPKNQRFVFGQRLADRAIGVLELLVEAAYSPHKADLLSRTNRDIEVLRWLVRLAKDRGLFTMRQYGFACKGLTECGRMVGGWHKQSAAKEGGTKVPRKKRRPRNGHPMHTHRRLFERIATLENLITAAQAALRGKRMRMPGAGFLADFEKEVFRLHDELWAGSYRHGGYTYFTIHEPKERIVAAAPFRDRVVHHAIVRVIEPIFEKRFIEDSFACRRGKGTHASMRRAAEFARRWPYALKCDVRKYFPSIDHEVLTGLLRRVIGDERLMALTRHILDSHADGQRQEWVPGGDLFDVQILKRGLPIGNLTSQFFANVYLNPLDHFVKHELRVKGYVRYMDDFLLFSDDRAGLRRQGREVCEKLAELRLEVHPDKYRLGPTACGVDFAGFVMYANGRVRVRSASVRRFDRRYKNMLWDVRCRRTRAARVTQSVVAWVAHAAHAQSDGLRRSVLAGKVNAGRQEAGGRD